MKKGLLKKILIGTGSTLGILIIVLCVHIYMVTRPKAPDAHTRIMVRVDFKQDINDADAEKIKTWLYAQNGVSHVVCNAEGNNAVFTYAPVQTNANAIVGRMNSELPYQGNRFMPSEEDMKKGCPVAAGGSFSKILSLFKHS